MTDKEVMQMALDALEFCDGYNGYIDVSEEITALEIALKQTNESCGNPKCKQVFNDFIEANRKLMHSESIPALRAALAQPKPQHRDVVIAGDLWRVEFLPNNDANVVLVKANYKTQPEKTDMQIGLTYEEANPPVAWMWNVNNGAGYLSRGIGFEQTNIPFAKHTPLYTAPTQREPVAWVDALDKARPDCVTDFKYLSAAQVNSGEHLKYIPLYTAPTKREWVGLTGEELKEIYQCDGTVHFKFALIEQALKDKNDA